MTGYKLVDQKAKAPKQATSGAGGFDLTAISVREYRKGILEYDTGVAVSIEHGLVGLLLPRSSITNMDLMLANSIGVIDSDYTGTIKMRFRTFGDNVYKVGERIGQLVVVPFDPEMMTVEELEATARGEGGFGSTGGYEL